MDAANRNTELTGEQHNHWRRHVKAAEIRALADRVVPEELDFEDDGESDAYDAVEELAKYEERQRLRALLTAEADRANFQT